MSQNVAKSALLKKGTLKYRLSNKSVLNVQTRPFAFVPGSECTSQLGDPFDCAERNVGCQSGIYSIYPQGDSQSVFCDMENECGGWTVKTCHFVLLYSEPKNSMHGHLCEFTLYFNVWDSYFLKWEKR